MMFQQIMLLEIAIPFMMFPLHLVLNTTATLSSMGMNL
jgi:hypothetical protein